MPTYDYRCDACDHHWELFQSMKDDPVKKCPSCGKNKAQRLIGAGAGLIFKGSGFYLTDYRSDSYKKAADADKKSTEPKPESKSDSKPESKPATDSGKKAKSST